MHTRESKGIIKNKVKEAQDTFFFRGDCCFTVYSSVIAECRSHLESEEAVFPG